MGTRRKSREIALQSLYQIEMSNQPPEEAFDIFCQHFEVSKQSLSYARELVFGVRGKWDEINEMIGVHADNWRMERMSVVDRNILRVAVYELCCQKDIPARVVINEAIEVAKRYGTDESGPFINGILDAIQKKMAIG
ncbi:MAG: transcription antitermination factor NusB [Deltaproteobacteria bacterium RIFOXYD12_FULL_57_12]|nr:MAG: transcription antitermination factor NusB [Deltaproteobacteria bacterium RIFOXYD12_FULL_57_12]